ncbi:MAG: site-2 protease family protein [Acutalibacteraceae bacterium]|nr:site-2 protease family protein [Clostridia bacterium]MEE3449524.1 site-2 protease family protein [Acutalibacteraceae bacterium]
MLISILKGEMSLIEIVMHIAAVILVILIILPFHELAHGFIAYKLGDDTAKKAGRLTFNPLHHIDYVGALCLILVGFGWADPVPVNPYNLKNPKRDMAFVALAGPAANIIAALAGGLLYNAFACFVPATSAAWYTAVIVFFQYYISVNIGLAVFNLIPLPPLDGSKILGALLPTEAYVAMMRNEKKLSMVLLVLIWLNIIDKLVFYPRIFIEYAVLFVTSLPFLPFS